MRYVIITPLKYTINDHNLNTVEQLWGLDLETNSKFIKNINVFAPFQVDQQIKTQDGSMYTFSKDSSITFTPLPNFKNNFDLLCNVPTIGYRVYAKTHKEDIVHCVGIGYPPIGIFANIILWLKKHKKYIFILDEDFVQSLELRTKSEKNALSKAFFNFLRFLYLNLFIFCIKTSPLTLVVGDNLYSRYQKYMNVYKIYASWVKETDIISDKEILEKSSRLLIKKEFKLSFVANLTYKKNPKAAIEILKILKNRGVPVTLDIFGEGPLRPELETLIKDYNLMEIIKFKGTVGHNSLNTILKEYDLIIVPNLNGEQVRIIFDAMASGVVVICSEIGSFKKVITNYKNGILCKPEDIEGFANLIECLFANRSKMIKIIKEGVATVKEQTIESMHKERVEIISNYFQL